jgi:hypothetical protein
MDISSRKKNWWIAGYLITPYQLQLLLRIEWQRVIAFEELVRLRQEALVAYFKVLFRNLLRETEEHYTQTPE